MRKHSRTIHSKDIKLEDIEREANMIHDIPNLEDETIAHSLGNDNEPTDILISTDLPTEPEVPHDAATNEGLLDSLPHSEVSTPEKGSSESESSKNSRKRRAGSKLEEGKQVSAVTFCKWGGCNTNFPNVGALGMHLSDHIRTQKVANRREKKSGYVCDWDGCNRQKRPFKVRKGLVTSLTYCVTGML
jgi:hypothetical protein